mgnify:FL=1
MTIDQKVQNTTYFLQPKQLVAFAVLADLKLAQRNAVINTNKIAEFVVLAKDMKFGFFNRTPVFDICEFEVDYMCSKYFSNTIEDYIKGLEMLELVINYDKPIATSKCIEKFKEIVNNLYQERPDIAKIYTKLVGSSPEKFFDSEGKGHYV